MAQHLIIVLLSRAPELESRESRDRLAENLRPFHSVQNALHSETPRVIFTEKGNAHATIAVAVEISDTDDPQTCVNEVLQLIGPHTAGQVDATEIVRVDGT